MKTFWLKDEWYPVYYLDLHNCGDGFSKFGTALNVPDELVERWKKAFKEFADCNNEISKIYLEGLD